MRRNRLTLLPLAIVALSVVAADPKPASLLDRMQGTWQAQQINDGPDKDPADGISLTIVGNRTFLTEHDRADASLVTLDTSRSPARFDLKGATSGDAGMSGVIAVDGDQLRVAFRKEGERADSFDPAPGKIVMTFKRVDAGPTTRP